MYSREKRLEAVRLYIELGCAATATLRMLGYPEDRKTIRAWYRSYMEHGETRARGIRTAGSGVIPPVEAGSARPSATFKHHTSCILPSRGVAYPHEPQAEILLLRTN